MSVSRRDFLLRVGQAGGYSAAFLAMQGLGLVEPVRAVAAPLAARGSGNGTRVVILGGGIAGLVAAYELRDLGYDCTVLEARGRPGGRNWTVRTGDTIEFIDGTKQRCEWDAGNYQNFGPARLPSIHPHMLGYCRKLGVELQVEVNMSRSEMLQNDNANGGKPVVMRQAENDTRGWVSELLSKCVQQGALDQQLSTDDRDRMLSFLRVYGPLDDANKYKGSDRAGYLRAPGVEDDGVLSQPIDLHTLLLEDFWQGMLFSEAFDMQATMFQPVGGMDRIPYAFAKSLGDIVRFNAPVTEIRKTGKGVRISYTQNGAPSTLDAEFCICAMPLTMVRKIPNDLSAPYKTTVDGCTYAAAFKIAWESRRFWEQDYNIYGGLEFCSTGLSPIWLPSAGMFADRGVLVSGYGFDTTPEFAALSFEQKLAESRKSIERLHPGHSKELEKPLYVNWGQIPYNEGAWISTYGPQPDAKATDPHLPRMRRRRTGPDPYFQTLLQPDGPIYFAGDHVSHIVGWQEGAAISALYAVQQISDRVKAARLASHSSALA
ncbi:MAG TPA: FAD-dependent oxidoreductase [Acidobacteriaceae bacterium]